MVDKQPHGREESFRGRVKPRVLGKHAWNREKDGKVPSHNTEKQAADYGSCCGCGYLSKCRQQGFRDGKVHHLIKMLIIPVF